ncbi:hypothetical protein BDV93DRAFT_561926 [Ceratobasidium sp. AG-I]|nr:hypothetical protein BDV93DRAFT_561926 [Ceratobasidium sp. AG-I]
MRKLLALKCQNSREFRAGIELAAANLAPAPAPAMRKFVGISRAEVRHFRVPKFRPDILTLTAGLNSLGLTTSDATSAWSPNLVNPVYMPTQRANLSNKLASTQKGFPKFRSGSAATPQSLGLLRTGAGSPGCCNSLSGPSTCSVVSSGSSGVRGVAGSSGKGSGAAVMCGVGGSAVWLRTKSGLFSSSIVPSGPDSKRRSSTKTGAAPTVLNQGFPSKRLFPPHATSTSNWIGFHTLATPTKADPL